MPLQLNLAIRFISMRLRRRWLALVFWIFVWNLVGLIFSTLFDSFKSEAAQLNATIEALPQGLKNSFNISNDYASSVENLISGQFLTLHLLIGAIFSYIIGLGEIGGKIDDHTIFQWLSSRLSRSSLFISQFITNSLFLLIGAVCIWAGLFVQFELLTSQENISQHYFGSAALSTGIFCIACTSLGQLLGVIVPRKIGQNVGIGYIIFAFFINSLSKINGFPESLNILSIFRLVDVVMLRDDYTINSNNIYSLMALTAISISIGILFFRTKDIHM